MRYLAVRRFVVDYKQDENGNTVEVAVEPGQPIPEQYTGGGTFDALLRQGLVREDGYSELDERLRVIEAHLGIDSPAPHITEPVVTDVMTRQPVSPAAPPEAAEAPRRRRKAGKHTQEAAA